MNDVDDGRKDDTGKLRWSLLPLGALEETVRVLTKGAEHYAPWGWESVPQARDRYTDALLRHVVAWRNGQRNDPQWGLHHLAHATCDILFLLSLDLRGEL